MSTKFRFSLLISIFVFILINSCDDNIITFNSGDSGINYYEQSFVLNLEKSLFEINPVHHIDDSLFNQSLAPMLYLGDIGLFEQEKFSYALFQINSDIINNYSICDSSLISIDDIIFTLKFDNPIYEDGQYVPNTGSQQILNNNVNHNSSNIEEDTDFYYTHLNINSYFYNATQISDSDIPLESDSNIHDDLYIQNLVDDIKQQNLILPSSRNSNYKIDLQLTNVINTEDWCNGNLESFYILIEYNPPNNNGYEKNISIVSTDNYYGLYQPKLTVDNSKETVIDSLLGSFIDIYNIQNSTMLIEATDSSEAMAAPTLTTISVIYLLDDVTSLENIADGDNIVAINVDNSSSEFGTFLGYQSPDSPPITFVTLI